MELKTADTKTDWSEKRRVWLENALAFGKEVFRIYTDNDVSIFSGNATLYILMAIVPFFALLVGLINFFPEEYLVSFFEMLTDLFPDIPQFQSLMTRLLEEINPQTGTLVVSISLLSMFSSATRGITGLQLGLLRIGSYHMNPVKRKISAYIYTVLFIIMIIALMIFRVLRTAVLDITQQIAAFLHMPEIASLIAGIMNNSRLITSIGIAVIVVITYTFLQGNTHKIRQQLPGAIVSTVLFIIFTALFEWFITKFWNASAVYGSFASVFLALLWLRTIITILMLGATFNEALFRRSRTKESSEPLPPVTESE